MASLGVVALLALVGCADGDSASPATSSSDSTADTIERTPTTSVAPEATTVAELLALGRPVVLAHAGGENAHPHSTPFAYGESVAGGVDVIDVDLRMTADGELVVHHDDDVDRTTDGSGDVADMTFDELHALDAAYWFTQECSACGDQPDEAYLYRGVRTGASDPPEGYDAEDFAPMRFESLVESYPDFVFNIEIKGSVPESVPAAEELARILTDHDRLDAAIVTAFEDELAEAFHVMAPEVAITPGLHAMTQYVLADVALPDGRTIVQIPPDYQGIDVLTPELVERAHADGLVLWIWPNERRWENAEGYTELLDMGVDGLNAADPEVAVQVVRSR